ncbi:hypothetical protein JOL79_03190 [Microbispora sp. RL4-1S]|uniref:Uncharacterized protein n=1 Tax=Microbispora oryzae TaxID=2806554 RepID=A0A941AHK3_9ACTN|nr:hypothetical protein [Microbispora oryzae]MBP2702807.1 hypothetical protein [Microbispora oryzae]
MPLPAPYHGLHVASLQMEHIKIRWLAPAGRSDRVRVRRHTCECMPVIYELCAAGGLLFVRRTDRSARKFEIAETDRLVTARMEPVWYKLITGMAV